jgi:hypothetical protein
MTEREPRIRRLEERLNDLERELIERGFIEPNVKVPPAPPVGAPQQAPGDGQREFRTFEAGRAAETPHGMPPNDKTDWGVEDPVERALRKEAEQKAGLSDDGA